MNPEDVLNGLLKRAAVVEKLQTDAAKALWHSIMAEYYGVLADLTQDKKQRAATQALVDDLEAEGIEEAGVWANAVGCRNEHDHLRRLIQDYKDAKMSLDEIRFAVRHNLCAKTYP
jgi:hypothetical protein